MAKRLGPPIHGPVVEPSFHTCRVGVVFSGSTSYVLTTVVGRIAVAVLAKEV
jgi:hypothetical protein